MKRVLSILPVVILMLSFACNGEEISSSRKVETSQMTDKANGQKTAGMLSTPIDTVSKPPFSSKADDPVSADPCETICLRSKELNCKLQGDVCEAACKESRDVPICIEEMASVMSCVVKEPATHWECTEEDIAAVKDGYCEKEQERFIRCLAVMIK